MGLVDPGWVGSGSPSAAIAASGNQPASSKRTVVVPGPSRMGFHFVSIGCVHRQNTLVGLQIRTKLGRRFEGPVGPAMCAASPTSPLISTVSDSGIISPNRPQWSREGSDFETVWGWCWLFQPSSRVYRVCHPPRFLRFLVSIRGAFVAGYWGSLFGKGS